MGSSDFAVGGVRPEVIDAITFFDSLPPVRKKEKNADNKLAEILSNTSSSDETKKQDIDLDKILSGKDSPSAPPPQQDLTDLLADLDAMDKEDTKTEVVEEEDNTPVAIEPKTEDDFAEIVASYYSDKTADDVKALSVGDLYKLYDEAFGNYNNAVKTGNNDDADIYDTLAKSIINLAGFKDEALAKAEEEKTQPENLLADLAESLKNNTNNPPVQKRIVKNSHLRDKHAQEIEDKTEKDFDGIGEGIISPINATLGLVKCIKGDFAEGQKQVRDAASDFASIPAGVVDAANDFFEAFTYDMFGETASKVITAPGNIVSGAWQTVSTSFDGKEGTTKSAFSKMTFGLFD